MSLVRLDGKAAEMEFADRVGGQVIDVTVRIEAHIVSAQMDIADIAQEATARAVHELAEKFGLGHGGGAKADIARRILDEVAAPKTVLDLADVLADDAQRLRVIG